MSHATARAGATWLTAAAIRPTIRTTCISPFSPQASTPANGRALDGLVNTCHSVGNYVPGVPASNQGLCRISSRPALDRARQCGDEDIDERILIVRRDQPPLRRTRVEVEKRRRPAG